MLIRHAPLENNIKSSTTRVNILKETLRVLITDEILGAKENVHPQLYRKFRGMCYWTVKICSH